MGHHRHHSRHRSVSSSSSSSDSSFDGKNVPGFWMGLQKAQSNDKREKGRKKSPEVIVNNLVVPKQKRGRSTSVGGAPAPQVVVIDNHDRSRSRSHRRRSSSSRSSSRSGYGGSSRGRGRLTFEEYEKIKEAEAYRISRKERDARDRADALYREKRKLDEMKWKLEEDQAKQKAAAQKDELERQHREWLADQKEKEAKEKARREQILLEAERDKEKKKKDEEELKKRILAEEAEKQKKKKEKEKKEEEEFEQKVKEKFMAAGYTPKQIEDILHRKKEDAKRNELAIAVQRPTFIKVHRKYLHPHTLEVYNLPWHYDPNDSDYIIIKQYIDNDFQEVLFEHTRTLYKKKLITDSYVKETTVTLRPSNVYKKEDQMYIVRNKSKSPSRGRRGSWMFT